jgi:hypothetical protein
MKAFIYGHVAFNIYAVCTTWSEKRRRTCSNLEKLTKVFEKEKLD